MPKMIIARYSSNLIFLFQLKLSALGRGIRSTAHGGYTFTAAVLNTGTARRAVWHSAKDKERAYRCSDCAPTTQISGQPHDHQMKTGVVPVFSTSEDLGKIE